LWFAGGVGLAGQEAKHQRAFGDVPLPVCWQRRRRFRQEKRRPYLPAAYSGGCGAILPCYLLLE